jgi:RNA polymerase sigma-70 factor, ECF subfamily
MVAAGFRLGRGRWDGLMNASGDAAAHDLYLEIAQYRDDAYRLARRLSRSSFEAEDLAQTAMLNVLRRAEYIEDETKIRAYLLTAVRNVWRNQLRSRAQRHFVGSDLAELIPSSDVQPEEVVLTDLDAALAGAAFTKLSRTSRDVIELRYIEGLDFHELGKRLGINPVAARQRAHRAREELVSACMELAANTATGECATIRGRLGRYHRGLLSRSVRAQVELHLSRCTGCASCYEQLIELYGHRLGQAARGNE